MKELIKELLLVPLLAFIVSMTIYGCLSIGRKTEEKARQEGYEDGYSEGYSDALTKYGIEE